MHQSLLSYKKFRYLKLTIIIIVSSIVLYLSQGDAQPANGGTIQGYILGIFAAFLILLLTYLGVRKRSYSSSAGTVQGWASAHVFLGSSLLLIASLHAAFQVGWNVHTLAYVLMLIVIFSGFYGLFAYLHYPRVLSTNNIGGSQDDWIKELYEIDDKVKDLSGLCRSNIRLVVLSALQNTQLENKLMPQLRARDRSKVVGQSGSKSLVSNKNQERVIDILAEAIPSSLKQAEADALNQILSLFSRRQRLLKIIRRNLQIKAYYKVWLLFHIPVTIALLAALIVHILVVFIYW
jgi:hypothetical protein